MPVLTGSRRTHHRSMLVHLLTSGAGSVENVVMVRAMRAMGVDYAAEYLQRFGFPAQNIVHTESLALGSASFTPMQVARGYAVMANGGFLVDPWFISKIENDQGGVIFEAKPSSLPGMRYSGDLR